MDETKALEAYARLQGLKANMPQSHELDMKYVKEYHDVLNILESASEADLGGFRVPDSETPVRKTKGDYVTESSPYYHVQTCDRSVLMMKIDSFLTFFELYTAERKSGKPSIGFNPPKVL